MEKLLKTSLLLIGGMSEIRERKTGLSETSPYERCVGRGEGRPEPCFQDSEGSRELAQRSRNNGCDEDTHTLLVRLVLRWVGGSGSESSLVYLVLVRKLGPASDAEVL